MGHPDGGPTRRGRPSGRDGGGAPARRTLAGTGSRAQRNLDAQPLAGAHLGVPLHRPPRRVDEPQAVPAGGQAHLARRVALDATVELDLGPVERRSRRGCPRRWRPAGGPGPPARPAAARTPWRTLGRAGDRAGVDVTGGAGAGGRRLGAADAAGRPQGTASGRRGQRPGRLRHRGGTSRIAAGPVSRDVCPTHHPVPTAMATSSAQREDHRGPPEARRGPGGGRGVGRRRDGGSPGGAKASAWGATGSRLARGGA